MKAVHTLDYCPTQFRHGYGIGATEEVVPAASYPVRLEQRLFKKLRDLSGSVTIMAPFTENLICAVLWWQRRRQWMCGGPWYVLGPHFRRGYYMGLTLVRKDWFPGRRWRHQYVDEFNNRLMYIMSAVNWVKSIREFIGCYVKGIGALNGCL